MIHFHILEQLLLQHWAYHPIINLFAEQTGFPRDDRLDCRGCGNMHTHHSCRILRFVNLHCLKAKFCARAYLARIVYFCLRRNLEFPSWSPGSQCFVVIIFGKDINKKGAFFLLSFVPRCSCSRVRYLISHSYSS